MNDVRRTFRDGDAAVNVLTGASLTLEQGELVALVAPSGAGKSTLLQIAGLLERADSGSVTVAGEETQALSDTQRTRLRRDAIGFVYQFHHLLADFSARENVALPARLRGDQPARALAAADALLERLGLAHRVSHRPAELSGGERQRVAIARAIINRPALLLADEPTGNLDEATGASVRDALLSMSRAEKLTALVATHNPNLASQLDRVITIRDGSIQEHS